ncbi:hypothetical protein FMEXI_12579 [Fusarium mexicanum]|uniref:Uncharacterized protein n=1 Tax=Fusarium mexicanum TaxID=751941 RepID=A0A8H5I9S7_9HYPO|nr:hypothetical protein FMEXI_12579 [Fusarium mexicanum]
MPPKMPRLDDLLALLEVFFAPERGALPGGTATKAELEVQVRLPLLSFSSPPAAAASGGLAVSSRHRRLGHLFWTSLSDTPILFHPPRLPASNAYGDTACMHAI